MPKIIESLIEVISEFREFKEYREFADWIQKNIPS